MVSIQTIIQTKLLLEGKGVWKRFLEMELEEELVEELEERIASLLR